MDNDWKTLNAMEEFELQLQMIIIVAHMIFCSTFHCQYWAQSDMLCPILPLEIFLDTTINTIKIFDRPLSICLLIIPTIGVLSKVVKGFPVFVSFPVLSPRLVSARQSWELNMRWRFQKNHLPSKVGSRERGKESFSPNNWSVGTLNVRMIQVTNTSSVGY